MTWCRIWGKKGVDMRIGLDIAWLSLKRIVDSVVLVTGDSDFCPSDEVCTPRRIEGLFRGDEPRGKTRAKGPRRHSSVSRFSRVRSFFYPQPLSFASLRSRGSTPIHALRFSYLHVSRVIPLPGVARSDRP